MDKILRLPDHIGISTALGSLGGIIIYLLGGLDQLLTTLLLLIVFDYLSGLLGAIHNKALSSDIGFKGIVRKVAMLVIVALSYAVGSFTGEAIPLREVTIMFFVANEGLSILENAAECGLPLPEKLRSTLVQLTDKSDRMSK